MSVGLPIEPYEPGPPEFLPPDPEAAAVAEAVAAYIGAALPACRVEHVGSTAVAGLGGKGIVDLLLLYPPGGLADARDALAALGFQRQTGRDPFPEERPMRTGAVAWAGRRYRLHVHVVAAGDPEAAALLAFRDRLRASAELCAAYERRKREILAAGVRDGVDYSEAKTGFIRAAAAPVPLVANDP